MRCEENRPVHDMIIHSIFFGNQQQSQPSTDLDLGGKPMLNRKRDDLRAMRHIRATISLREWNTSPLVRHSYTRITFLHSSSYIFIHSSPCHPHRPNLGQAGAYVPCGALAAEPACSAQIYHVPTTTMRLS